MRKLGIISLVTGLALTNAGPAWANSAQFDDLFGRSRAAMLAEPGQALALARQAAAATNDMAEGPLRNTDLLQAHWLEAEALSRTGDIDQADKVAAAALTQISQQSPGTKLHADLLATNGSIAKSRGEFGKALLLYQQSYGIHLRLGDRRSQAKMLQWIGSIYFDAGNYERMLKYYSDSADLFDDPAIRLSAYNNQGDALKEMKRYGDALALYRQALDVAKTMDSEGLTASILTNMASAQFLAGDLDAAEALVNQGLATPGLAETGQEPFLWGVRAQIAWASKDAAAARSALDRTFAGQDLANTPPEFREFHQLGSAVYAATGDYQKALEHARGWQRLDHQMRDVMAQANTALLGAQFDFASQELKVSRLKARQLESRIALENSRQKFNRLALFGMAALLAIAFLVVLGLMKALRSIRLSRNEADRANVALSSTNEELERAIKAKSRFLATTSHEIRTPLNGILGLTEVLLADETMGGVARERVRTVNEAGNTMKALVDDILDAAKMDTSGVTIERDLVHIKPLLSDIVRLWEGQAANAGIEIIVDMTACSEIALCDPRRLRQILFNLMSNAVKFTEKGKVTLDAREDGGNLIVAVHDTGIGIDSAHLNDIFTSFYQIDNSTSRQIGGSGLGLSISRNLARAMGGDIVAKSVMGKGSTFTLTLPLSDVASQDQAEPAPVLAPREILLIEANPLGRNVMASALSALGPAVVQAGGLDMARTGKPEGLALIVADLDSIGGLDGVESLLSAPDWAGIVAPFLLLVKGDISAELEERAARLGIHRLLSRPMPIPDLCAAAKVLLDNEQDRPLPKALEAA